MRLNGQESSIASLVPQPGARSRARPTWTAPGASRRARACGTSSLISSKRASHPPPAANAQRRHRAFKPPAGEPGRQAQKNVAHHYDFGNDFLSPFLDAACSIPAPTSTRPDDDARERPRRPRSATSPPSCPSSPGQPCSTSARAGATSPSISPRDYGGANVTGVTLSQEQHRRSPASRPSGWALPSVCASTCSDYRDVDGRFDRIVSVGMFEHVGVHHLRRVLREDATPADADDGVDAAALHRPASSRPGAASPWLRKYIFPGAYSPGAVGGLHGGRASRACG